MVKAYCSNADAWQSNTRMFTPAELLRVHVLLRTLEVSVAGEAVIRTGVQGVRIMRLVALMAHGAPGEALSAWGRWLSMPVPYLGTVGRVAGGPDAWARSDWRSMVTPPSASQQRNGAARKERAVPHSASRRGNRPVFLALGIVAVSAIFVVAQTRHWLPHPSVKASQPLDAGAQAHVAATLPAQRVDTPAALLGSAPSSDTQASVSNPGASAQVEQVIAQDTASTAPSSPKHGAPALAVHARPKQAEVPKRQERALSPRETHAVSLVESSRSHRQYEHEGERETFSGDYPSPEALQALRDADAAHRATTPRISAGDKAWMNYMAQRKVTEIPDQFTQ
jgi:hypothetical protein